MTDYLNKTTKMQAKRARRHNCGVHRDAAPLAPTSTGSRCRGDSPSAADMMRT